MKKITFTLFALLVTTFSWQISAQLVTFCGAGNPQPVPPTGTGGPSCENGPTNSGAFVTQVGIIGTGPNEYSIDNVSLDITHTWDGDLQITLVSPSGTTLDLSNSNGGSGDNYTNTIFQDGNPNIITGSPPFSGTFEAQAGTFAATFAGEPINGNWTLSICDNAGEDTGTLNNYCISFIQPPITCPSDIIVDNDPGVCGATVTYTDPIVNSDIPPQTIPGFTTVGYNQGSMFYISNNALTAPNAYLNAVSNGGYMASINDAIDNQFISDYLAANGGGRAWIGLNDVAVENNFVWQNGDPVTYTNWNVGEPNNSFPGEDYVEIFASGLWNDNGSTFLAPYILEIPGEALHQTDGLPSGSVFPVGTTTNTFEATDGSGTTYTCSFNVTVNDTEAPTITCPANITTNNDPSVCGATVTFTDPTATDNCGFLNLATNGDASDGLNGWTITQNGGNGWNTTPSNRFITSYNLCVKEQTIDLLAAGYTASGLDKSPNITVSEDYQGTWPNYSDLYFLNVELLDASNTVLASFNSGNITCTSALQTISHTFSNYPTGVRYIRVEHGGDDAEFWAGWYGTLIGNLNVNIPIIQTGGLASGSVFPVGTTTNTFEVIDASGNTATCSFDVTVNDTEAPNTICQNITVQLDASGQTTITAADVDGGSTDNCGIDSINIDIFAFDCSNVGANNVTLTVTDVNGNSSSCVAVVTVEDSIAPIISCPTDVVANTDPGICGAEVFFSDAIGIDNCGIATVIQTVGLPSGSVFPVGVNTVEYTITDVNGNSSTCSFTITITDNEPPITVCQNITLQLDASGQATITPADIDGGSTDNCGIDSLNIDVFAFDCSNVGANNVTLTVTDVNGNSSSCIAVVTVEDVTLPVVSCQNITVQLDANGMATISGIDVDNGSSDACGIASYDLDINTFDCSNVGDNTVILTVTDVNGNSDTCTAIVTVEDNITPTLICMDITLPLGVDGTASITATDVIDTIEDACGIDTSAVDITDFSCADIGAPIQVQVFTIDVNGNLASCFATVTVVDDMAPIVTCPGDQTVEVDAATVLYEVPDYWANGDASAMDNCTDPVTIFTQDPAPGSFLSDGVYTVTLGAEDAYGNIGTCTFELTVETVLGVTDNTVNISSVTIYPNPAASYFNISNPNQINLEKVIIYDLTGKVVQNVDLSNVETEKTIDVSALASSTYVVRIISTQGEIVKQLVKE